MGREAKSRRCWSSSLSLRSSHFLLSPLFPSLSLPLSFLSSPLSNMCLVALCGHVTPSRLRTETRALLLRRWLAVTAIFAFGGGDQRARRVQVSGLTGRRPYLAQVAPSDRLKVRADLVCIDDSVLCPFLFLSTHNGQR